jgi:hypothetical protein
MTMTSSRLKCRCIQLACLLVQAVVLWAFAYFMAAVFALSSKGYNAPGMTLEGWGYLVAALVVAAFLYLVTGRVRDRATKQLRPTFPDSELRTPPSALR